jgi:sucrose phosphorylase
MVRRARRGAAVTVGTVTQAQLITYVDRLAGDLRGLARLLRGPLAGVVGGVHLLPFFDPIDGADAGFDPVDHSRVDARLGDWADVAELARDHEVMADLICNHVSARSPQFLDWLGRGDDSPYRDLFVTYGTVFPDGATEADLLAIYRPRPGLPFTVYTRADGSRRIVWTTFTPQQVDIDVTSPAGRDYLFGLVDRFGAHGITSLRLDAVGYAVKTAGASSFLTPGTFTFVDELTARARDAGMGVLVEVHSHYQRQIDIAARVDLVYDFALPPLVLHTLFTGDTAALRRWLEIRPGNAVTVLDTHDGIGVIDVGADSIPPHPPGILTPAEVDSLVNGIHQRSGGQSRQATGAAASNLDLYQVNCTFLDALGGDERAYLTARLIQLFVPGIPQVYYVGLLGGRNDMELLARTGIGRDINRHHYTADEVTAALATPLVRAQCAALRLRNTHAAFGGEFTVGGDGGRLVLRRQAGGHVAELDVDAAEGTCRVSWTAEAGSTREVTDPLDLA